MSPIATQLCQPLSIENVHVVRFCRIYFVLSLENFENDNPCQSLFRALIQEKVQIFLNNRTEHKPKALKFRPSWGAIARFRNELALEDIPSQNERNPNFFQP